MSESAPLISVIISSYNRFSLLCGAVQSVRDQTYPNIEIIVVNDASTEPEYYSKRLPGNVTMIHLARNSRERFGYPCAGYVRNIGARIANGQYLAFLDDDDLWLPHKLSAQMAARNGGGVPPAFSCTDGYIGREPWNFLLGYPDKDSGFKVYNKEHYFDTLCCIYNGSDTAFDLRADGFPAKWNRDFLKIHNCVITSSVVMSRALFEEMRGFRELRNGEEDYDLWRRVTESGTTITYVDEPLFYYLLRGN